MLLSKNHLPSNIKEAEELIALAKKQNKILSVYQNRRYDSDYKTVKKVLDKKLLGDLIEAEIHFDRFSEELSPKKHKETPGPGAGVVYDLGSHIIDQALQLFGMPEKIFADIRIIRPLSKVDDYFEIAVVLSKTACTPQIKLSCERSLARIYFSWIKRIFYKSQKPTYRKPCWSQEICRAEKIGVPNQKQKKACYIQKSTAWKRREYINSEQGNYGDYYQGIYEAIRNNKPFPVTAEDGEKVIKIIQTAFESNKIQKVIEL